MCCKKQREKVKEWDYFGTPIGVTFDGESTYKTPLGGYLTMLIILFIGGNALVTVLQVLFAPTYSSKTKSTFD